MLGGRTALASAALAAVLVSAGILVGTAGASHQPAKNGCTSSSVPGGALMSPQFAIQIPQTLTYRYWFEIESVAPQNDAVLVELTEDNGATWQVVDNLAPTSPPPGARPDLPVSNRGLAPPDWQNGSINLPSTVDRVRFRSVASDTRRQGFRGWAIDTTTLSGGLIGGTDPSWSFETSLGSWTATGLWHVQQNPQTISVVPGINPELVTLPDAGALPPADGGSSGNVWFGEAATGTYCGADFAGAPELSLSPLSGALTSGQTHTITASAPHAGGIVRFSVNGANATTHSAPVPAGGSAAFRYTGANFGRDAITAFLDVNGDGAQQAGEPGANAEVEWRPRSVDDLADPVPFMDVNVQPVAGDVFVRLPAGASRAARAALRRASDGARASQAPRGFVPLAQAGKIPLGSQIDTTKGRVLLESAASRTVGRTQRSEFYNGRFTVVQRRAVRPITDIVLKGGSFRGCRRSRASASHEPQADASQRRTRGRRVRRLWGNGRGRFRTRGRYSSATVRGTKWIVEDRCNGTLTRVARRPRTNRVVVRDLVRRRIVTLRAGRSYFAAKR